MRMLFCIAGLGLATASAAVAQTAPSPAPSASDARPAPAGAGGEHAGPRSDNDPWEGFNRRMYGLNDTLDKHAFRPLATGYTHVVPKPVREGLHNVYSNLGDVRVLANDVIQFRPKQAGTTLGRIAANSTLGMVGVFDVATPIGLPHHDNDFGLTLGRANLDVGPYLFFPVMGPTDVRDFAGSLVDTIAFDPLVWTSFGDKAAMVQGTGIVTQGLDRRARSDAELKALNETSVDPYASLRSVYIQSRNSAAGKAQPLEEFPDFDEPDQDSAAPPPTPIAPAPSDIPRPPAAAPSPPKPHASDPASALPLTAKRGDALPALIQPTPAALGSPESVGLSADEAPKL
jgi:phospholipid-binding lipoprotein MlaA